MFDKIISAVFGWKGMLFGVGIAVAFGFAAGYYTKDKFCEAAAAREQIEQANDRIAALQDNIRLMREAADRDTQLAAADRERMAQLKEQHRAIVAEITVRECLTRDDVERLQRGWGAPAVQPRSSSR